MRRLRELYRDTDVRLTRWMARHGVAYLRISLGAVFLWFGVLKFFPGMSPAEDLAADTIARMSFGLVAGRGAVVTVAALETLIGAGLVAGVALRLTLLLLWLQMAGTLMPVLLFPERVFRVVPYAPTLEDLLELFYVEVGVDGVFSDYPDVAARVRIWTHKVQ